METNLQTFSIYGLFIIMIFIAGLYCVVMTRNLMRMLMGIEVLIKGVTLLLIVAGYVTGKEALAQALVITMIVIEVIVIAVSAGVILSIYRENSSLDRRNLVNLEK
jgi:NADH-quinone oxidoreductase subunit K